MLPGTDKPMIVQGDKTVLLEVDNKRYEEARDALSRFAELVKSPEHIHTYRITPLSLWNAAAAGVGADYVIKTLQDYGKYELPANVRVDVQDYVSRYGRIKLYKSDGNLLLGSDDAILITEITHNKRLQPFVLSQIDAHTLLVNPADRGRVKQALVNFGYPAEDLAGYVEGTPLPIGLLAVTRSGSDFNLRHYQVEAVDVFHAGGAARGGSGVIVLPCGAGKTMVSVIGVVWPPAVGAAGAAAVGSGVGVAVVSEDGEATVEAAGAVASGCA